MREFSETVTFTLARCSYPVFASRPRLKVHSNFLRGAVLLDLALDQRIVQKGPSLEIDTASTGVGVFDSLLQAVSRHPGRTLHSWVLRGPADHLDVARRLVDAGEWARKATRRNFREVDPQSGERASQALKAAITADTAPPAGIIAATILDVLCPDRWESMVDQLRDRKKMGGAGWLLPGVLETLERCVSGGPENDAAAKAGYTINFLH